MTVCDRSSNCLEVVSEDEARGEVARWAKSREIGGYEEFLVDGCLYWVAARDVELVGKSRVEANPKAFAFASLVW